MRVVSKGAVVAFGLALALTACKKTADIKPNYDTAINTYYESHPACLWDSAKKFPVQIGHSDPDMAQYDALVDQGLLTRTSVEKKIIIISKQQNNYDVSDKGRSAWTVDPSQPGYGNFCYGHRKVSSIDSNTPSTDQPGATTTVQYHYTFSDAPTWATAAETQTAYPSMAANLSATPKAGSANLTNTANGWVVSNVGQPAGAGGRIVE